MATLSWAISSNSSIVFVIKTNSLTEIKFTVAMAKITIPRYNKRYRNADIIGFATLAESEAINRREFKIGALIPEIK